MRLARVLGAIGRTCITAGVLILLFVAYQLWGTGIREAQAQNRLEDDFAEVLDEAASTPTTTTPPTSVPGETPPPPRPSRRCPRAIPRPIWSSPRSASTRSSSRGWRCPTSRRAPATTRSRPCPGQEGNAAIAGHRTTYGAPFNRIDELEAG